MLEEEIKKKDIEKIAGAKVARMRDYFLLKLDKIRTKNAVLTKCFILSINWNVPSFGFSRLEFNVFNFLLGSVHCISYI